VKQQFLPDEVCHNRLWHAQENPSEAKLKDRMVQLWGDRFKE
jgi:putative ATPase